MPSLSLLESPHAWHVVVFLASILEALLHLRVKLGLIAFDRQHVIGALVDISPSAPQIAAHKAMTTISISR